MSLHRACVLLDKPDDGFGDSFDEFDETVNKICWDLSYMGKLDSSYRIVMRFMNHYLMKFGM